MTALTIKWSLLIVALGQCACGAVFVTFDNWNAYDDNDYVNNFVFCPSGPYSGQHQMVTSGGKTGGALSLGYYSGYSFLRVPMSNTVGRVHQASVFFKRPVGGTVSDTLAALFLSTSTNSLTNGSILLRAQSEPTNNGALGRMWLEAEYSDAMGQPNRQQFEYIEDASGEGFGEWFRLSFSVWMKDPPGGVLVSGALEKWTADGTEFSSLVASFFHDLICTNLAEARDIYFGLWGTQVNDSYLDDFAADSFDAIEGFFRGPIGLRVSEVEVSWPARLDKIYQIQYQADVSSNVWVNAGPPVRAITPRPSFTDKVPEDAPKRFYRVIELP